MYVCVSVCVFGRGDGFADIFRLKFGLRLAADHNNYAGTVHDYDVRVTRFSSRTRKSRGSRGKTRKRRQGRVLCAKKEINNERHIYIYIIRNKYVLRERVTREFQAFHRDGVLSSSIDCLIKPTTNYGPPDGVRTSVEKAIDGNANYFFLLYLRLN